MSGELKRLNTEWKTRIENSPEAKKAKLNLNYHRKKIQQMHEEFSRAEAWEKELENRLKNIEESVKPPFLILTEQLESPRPVDDSIIEASINEEDPEQLISLLRTKSMTMKQMDRSQLLGFVKTTIDVRNNFLEKDNQHGVGVMQELASGVLKQLGRGSIDWKNLTPWEANLLKMIILEVEGVPGFIVKFMEQMLTNIQTQDQVGTNSCHQSNVSHHSVRGSSSNRNSSL